MTKTSNSVLAGSPLTLTTIFSAPFSLNNSIDPAAPAMQLSVVALPERANCPVASGLSGLFLFFLFFFLFFFFFASALCRPAIPTSAAAAAPPSPKRRRVQVSNPVESMRSSVERTLLSRPVAALRRHWPRQAYASGSTPAVNSETPILSKIRQYDARLGRDLARINVEERRSCFP
jgi:hypothetical protein